MADYYLVELARGPAWDYSRKRREQAGWTEHAAYMDALTEEGLILLGGPIGEGDGENSLLIFDMDSVAAVKARLADDPWMGSILTLASIRPWSVWLRGQR